MKEPSLVKLLLRSLFHLSGGLNPEEKEYCGLRDRLWVRYKLNRGLNRARIFGATMRFIRFDAFMRLLDEIFGKKSYIFKTQSKAPLILDLGANIGMSVLFFKKNFPNCRVVAFEPDPKNFEILTENMKANRWKDVELHSFALSHKEEEIDLYLHPEGEASLESTVYPGKVAGAVAYRVKALPLSRFVTEDVDFVKMDIEGSESAVLEELASSGALKRIKALAIEYHHHMVPEEDKVASFLKILEENGFAYILFSPFEYPDAGAHFQDILIHAWQKQ